MSSGKWQPFCVGFNVLSIEAQHCNGTELYYVQACIVSSELHTITNKISHWGWDKMADMFTDGIFKCIFLIKNIWILIKFHWSLFLRFQLTIFQHWFRKWHTITYRIYTHTHTHISVGSPQSLPHSPDYLIKGTFMGLQWGTCECTSTPQQAWQMFIPSIVSLISKTLTTVHEMGKLHGMLSYWFWVHVNRTTRYILVARNFSKESTN